MKKLFFLFFIIITFNCNSQNRYYSGYQFSDSIIHQFVIDSAKGKIVLDSVHGKSIYIEQTATKFSFINDYKDDLIYWDKGEKSVLPTVADNWIALGYKPLNAKDYIIERAKKEKIIIINEAHHQPIHRVFTESLLEELYKEGYRYFGLEAVNKSDRNLNKRKYPLVTISGWYINQSQGGNLVRKALQLGYYVFGYDSMHGLQAKDREIIEAKNIKAVLDKDPNAKMIIHCGYGHLSESEDPHYIKMMAARLKEYTGIDPFTIDQVRLTEHSSPDFENAFYKAFDLNYYAVFTDSLGNLYNGSAQINSHDCEVYHPRTKWIDGRPDWLFENNRSAVYITDKINLKFPFFVYAFYINEDLKYCPVPTDIVEFKSKIDKMALSLDRGGFFIMAQDKKGNKQEFYLFRFVILSKIMNLRTCNLFIPMYK